jgi:hypothetical protein
MATLLEASSDHSFHTRVLSPHSEFTMAEQVVDVLHPGRSSIHKEVSEMLARMYRIFHKNLNASVTFFLFLKNILAFCA